MPFQLRLPVEHLAVCSDQQSVMMHGRSYDETIRWVSGLIVKRTSQQGNMSIQGNFLNARLQQIDPPGLYGNWQFDSAMLGKQG